VTANSGRMTKDGGGFNLRAGWSDAGQAVEKRIRKQGGCLTRSAMLAVGFCDGGRRHLLRSHPDHSRGYVAFVVDRLLTAANP